MRGHYVPAAISDNRAGGGVNQFTRVAVFPRGIAKRRTAMPAPAKVAVIQGFRRRGWSRLRRDAIAEHDPRPHKLSVSIQKLAFFSNSGTLKSRDRST
jgi:hypothetical protein